MRATLDEVSELHAGDPSWWRTFCGEVADKGHAAVKREKERRGWAANALWVWITGDVERYGEYRSALEFYVASRVHETSAVVDAGPEVGEDVNRDRLRVLQAFKLAEKVDPVNWGSRTQHTVQVVGDLGDRLRRARGRVVEAEVLEVVEEGEI